MLVVDALEVVDVDQQHRALEAATRAGGAFHGGQQVAAVGQAGERVAFAGHLQLFVAAVQLRVAVAHAAHEHRYQGQQQHAGGDAGSPQALLQVAPVQRGFLQSVFHLQRSQLALAAVGVEAFLEFEHGLLVLALEHLVGQAAVLAERGPGFAQQTHLLQHVAQLFLDAQLLRK